MAIDFFLAFNAPVFIKVCSVQSKEKGDNYSYKPMLNVLFKNSYIGYPVQKLVFYIVYGTARFLMEFIALSLSY